MTEKIDKKAKRTALDKILESDTFAHSQIYRQLLTYLVEASIKNSPPKEYAIASEVFHKASDFDPSHDTIVRVYVYNLRKKLEHYYAHEGLNEQIRIKIPKGHYEIEFVHHDKPKHKVATKTYLVLLLIVSLIVSNVIFIYSFYNINNPNSKSAPSSHPIWQDFLNNGHPKQIVLGDHFFFIKDSHDWEKRTIMRRDDINSTQEFMDYKEADIDRRSYVKLRYPMFPRNSVWPFADIVTLFSDSHIDFQLDFASNVNASDFKDKDMIFMGSFHTLATFDQTFRNSHFSYSVYPNVLTCYDETADTTITFYEQGDPVYNHIDYGIARKIPGPEQKTIYIFTSFHETGIHGVVKYFTEEETLNELGHILTQKFGYIPSYYEILFKASGYNRTVYTTDVEMVFEISAASKFW